MATLLKRMFWLAVLGGAGYAVWSALQRRDDAPSAPPEWPPLDDETSAAVEAAPVAAGVAPLAGAAGDRAAADAVDAAPWVEPDDGQCPLSHPIKANDNSGIYHVPGGRFYDRTGAERCYARAEDAEADGYRAAKS